MKIDRPIIIALITLLIVFLIFFFVAPEYKKFKKLQNELLVKTAEYNAQQEYYAAIGKTYNSLMAYKEDIAKIDDALPENPSLNKIVYYLQDIVKKNGLILKNIFLSKTLSDKASSSKNSTIKEIVFSVELMGNYSSLESFIISLEKSVKIFDVVTISFGSNVSTSSSGSSLSSINLSNMQSFSLQIKTYSY